MSYIGNRPENDAVINHIEYVATAGQTLFPVVYDSYVEVYLNGVRLAEDDFVKNNNVSISLVVGATAGDIVAVSGYQKVRSDSVASTDNAVPRFNGTNGELKNSNLIVDDKGNIGVGVTPKNWDIDANMQALDFGNNAIMADDTSISTMQNCYFSESTNAFKYTTTGTASISYLSNGLMVVRTAPSGAADTDITFTTILTIHPNGGIQLPNANTTNNLLLHWVERATATLTLTGLTTTVTTTARFERVGNTVHISFDSASGTSNATTLTITGVPLNFRPTANRSFTLRGINNGSQLPTPALAVLTTDGTSILYSDFGGSSWASSGTKGIYTFEASYSI